MNEKTEDPIPTIRELHPAFTEEEIREAETFWISYLNLALRIYERTHRIPQRRRHAGTLTSRAAPPTMKGERSKNNTRIL